MGIDKISSNKARMLYYGMLSKFFIFNFKEDRFKDVNSMLEIIAQNPLDMASEKASRNLFEITKDNYKKLVDEYDTLFNNPETKLIGYSASFYGEGVEFAQKCLLTKDILAKTDIRRNEAEFKESEDSIGFLLVLMHNLISGSLNGKKSYEKLQVELFSKIINPFVDFFIKNLYEHPNSKHYKDISILLNSFMDFERLYFDIPKETKKQKAVNEEGLSKSEALRRATNRARKLADKNNKKGEVNARR